MPKTCPQCQSEAADAATFCPSCGASLGASGRRERTATAATAGGASRSRCPGRSASPDRRSRPSSSTPPAGRWPTGSPASRRSFCSSGCFFLGSPIRHRHRRRLAQRSRQRLVARVDCTSPDPVASSIVAYLVLRAGWDELPISQKVPHLTVMMAATIVNAVLVLIAFIDKPGGWRSRLGFRRRPGAHRGARRARRRTRVPQIARARRCETWLRRRRPARPGQSR